MRRRRTPATASAVAPASVARGSSTRTSAHPAARRHVDLARRSPRRGRAARRSAPAAPSPSTAVASDHGPGTVRAATTASSVVETCRTRSDARRHASRAPDPRPAAEVRAPAPRPSPRSAGIVSRPSVTSTSPAWTCGVDGGRRHRPGYAPPMRGEHRVCLRVAVPCRAPGGVIDAPIVAHRGGGASAPSCGRRPVGPLRALGIALHAAYTTRPGGSPPSVSSASHEDDPRRRRRAQHRGPRPPLPREGGLRRRRGRGRRGGPRGARPPRARPRRAGPHAAAARRLRGLPRDPPSRSHAGAHPHGAERRRGRGRRPGARRGRLRDEAVQPAGARRAREGDPPADRGHRPRRAPASRWARSASTRGGATRPWTGGRWSCAPASSTCSSPSPATRGSCSRATPCSSASGRRTSPARPGRSTSTSRSCARSSVRTAHGSRRSASVGYRMVPPARAARDRARLGVPTSAVTRSLAVQDRGRVRGALAGAPRRRRDGDVHRPPRPARGGHRRPPRGHRRRASRVARGSSSRPGQRRARSCGASTRTIPDRRLRHVPHRRRAPRRTSAPDGPTGAVDVDPASASGAITHGTARDRARTGAAVRRGRRPPGGGRGRRARDRRLGPGHVRRRGVPRRDADAPGRRARAAARRRPGRLAPLAVRRRTAAAPLRATADVTVAPGRRRCPWRDRPRSASSPATSTR